MAVDLHLHTTASDGTLSPSELVHKAVSLELSALSITDHDSFGGIDEATAVAREHDIELIPGVELSSYYRGQDVHILGYFIDYRDPVLTERLRYLRESRELRARKIVEKLSDRGAEVTWADVEKYAKGEAVGRPHVAQALVDRGVVGNISEAFELYLGRNGPAYVPKYVLDLEDIFDIIHGAGGLASLAHPNHWGADRKVIEKLSDRGLDAVEVWHIDHSEEDTRLYTEIANELGLLLTGGSDCHGARKKHGFVIGTLDIPDEIIEPLRDRAAEIRAEHAAN